MTPKKKKKRIYTRKCGYCGDRYDQRDMFRVSFSPNGWICHDCYELHVIYEHPEYDIEEW